MARLTLVREPAMVADATGQPLEACKNVDPETMFPDESLPNDASEVETARAVCQSCFFRDECLTKAVARREQYGVWGGLTTKERNALIRRRNRLRRGHDVTLFGEAL